MQQQRTEAEQSSTGTGAAILLAGRLLSRNDGLERAFARPSGGTCDELNPGIYCMVELKVPRRTPSLIVPAGAIVFDRDSLHVLVVENGVAHSRKIAEIRDLGTEVEVSDGVKQGG
jgi:hypothetical protein